MNWVSGGDARSDVGRDAVVPLDGGSRLPREVLGNKAFGINLMRTRGLPVPPAFCLVTDVCAAFLAGDERVLDRVWPDVLAGLQGLERETSCSFGRGPRPLLLSVRSGAALSLPGMLDTVLNLGIDDTVHQALAAQNSAEFAADTRSRFGAMYRRIVLGGNSSAEVPDDPFVQLRGAIEAVFASWTSPRAAAYRAHHGLGDAGGTAVVVQAMVFGNIGPDSGSGVLFSRNPATGADEPLGEWLPGAQGEDVVSGTFDCLPLDALRTAHPGVFAELMAVSDELERLGGDVQDIEFTVERGTLWLLQTRVAKRSAQAAVRLALAFRAAGLIDDAEVLRRVTPEHVRTVLSPSLRPEARLTATSLATGLPASPGVASGTAHTDLDAALDAADAGQDVILVRTVTSPDDVAGMLAARAIVTEIGGATSHAAVVSREIGRPAVVGCGAGVAATLGGRVITVDGGEGKVFDGALELTVWSERDSPDLLEVAAIAVREAVARGLNDVVCDTPLVAMLTALRLAEDGGRLRSERLSDG
jgi:pyruvate,orthophosphate dikinase